MGSHSLCGEAGGEVGAGDEGEAAGVEEGGGTQGTTILR